MFADLNYSSLKTFAFILHKIFKTIYTRVKIDNDKLNEFKTMLKNNKDIPIIYIPTHRSYIDFLLMSYVLYANNEKVPHIVAGEDFLSMKGVNTLLR